MDEQYTHGELPDALTSYLRTNLHARRFRQRSVLLFINGKWNLVCCVIEAFAPDENPPPAVGSRIYAQVLLHENFLTGEECIAFANSLNGGTASIENAALSVGQPSQWTIRPLEVNNDHMQHAGLVISIHLSVSGGYAVVRPLVDAGSPYYPDSEEAARNWLPFPIYSGNGDGRNNKVLFLLPETRAYIADAGFNGDDMLSIEIGGSEVGKRTLLIRGAYWTQAGLSQFEGNVADAVVKLPVPSSARRLEFYLIDAQSVIYDFHKEERNFARSTGRSLLAPKSHAGVDLVRSAQAQGEGLYVEFKPFVELEKKSHQSGGRTKFLELAITAVAFANASGGHIYLGINDDCTISGVDAGLQKWAQAKVDIDVIERYSGQLKSGLKNLIYGEVLLNLSHVQVDGAIVILVEVIEVADKPIRLVSEPILYMRSGANNRKVPPELWTSQIVRNQRLDSIGRDFWNH